MRRTYFIVTTNQTPRNRRQICLHAQFCAIKLAKTPKLFKVNVHENIHWLNQQDLMVTQIGLEEARPILKQTCRRKLNVKKISSFLIQEDQEMVIMMFGPETILFLGSLGNFQCSERIRHVPPRGI